MLYPIGIQSFEEIRNGGYVYVDKTSLIYKLTSTGKYYFLSRPRRFGKSLLLSTMEAYFSGRKELFEGLAMASLEKDWVSYPVLHLDLTGAAYLSVDELYSKLNSFLSKYEERYEICTGERVASVRFENIIDAAYRKTGQKVVILIDEYEKPIIDNIDNPELMEQFRRELQGFYSVIKGKDNAIRFAFLTGVTKLGKTNMLSGGLNNLNDISMDARYSDICGITEDEVRKQFQESVIDLANSNDISIEECHTKLVKKYGGYHFHHESSGCFNPFSLLSTFDAKKFRMSWSETCVPSYLIRYLKQGNCIIPNTPSEFVPEETLMGASLEGAAAIMLMYQTGYLTIKDYNPRFYTYSLDYPNEEVKCSFLHSFS